MRCLNKQLFLWQLVLLLLFNGLASAENFSFAILADPHITCNEVKVSEINSAVSWIIANKEITNIELVFILGDIAWGICGQERSLVIAKSVFDQLNEDGILYIPVICDNEAQSGSVKEFHETFELQYKKLADVLPRFKREVAFTEDIYLHNFSFDYKECHFICPDFLSRTPGNEGGDLHDYENGSWPWFMNDLKTAPKTKKENIVTISHIGMFQTGFTFFDKYLFSTQLMNRIKQELEPFRLNIAANYCGHNHMNWHAVVGAISKGQIYDVWMTDECWRDTRHFDYSTTIRWVQVDTSGETIIYRQNLETLTR